jgi:hypothetical protein
MAVENTSLLGYVPGPVSSALGDELLHPSRPPVRWVSVTSESGLPHFAIVGWPKCGTTSLRKNLRSHPAFVIPDREVVWPRNPELVIEQLNASLQARSVRSPRGPGRSSAAGRREGVPTASLLRAGIESPSFVHSPRSLSLFAAVHLPMKIIACTRDPIAWLDSYYNYRVDEFLNPRSWMHTNYGWMRGLYHEQDLRRRFGAQGRPPGMLAIALGMNWAGVALELAPQAAHVHALRQRFGRAQVLVVPLDAVATNATRQYGRVLDFLFDGVVSSERSVWVDADLRLLSSANRVFNPSRRQQLSERARHANVTYEFVCANSTVRELVVAAFYRETYDLAACISRANGADEMARQVHVPHE